MRKMTTIVAFAATIMLMGAVAQAQIWQTWGDSTNPFGADQPSYSAVGGTAGVVNFNRSTDQSVTDLYLTANGTQFRNGANKTLTVENVYANAASLGSVNTLLLPVGANAFNGTVTNFWLQAGVTTPRIGNSDRPWGATDISSIVTLTNSSVGIEDGNSANRGSSGWLSGANFGVKVAEESTLGGLIYGGGAVDNAGTITKLSFAENFLAYGNDGFGFGSDFSFGKVGTVDLTNFAFADDYQFAIGAGSLWADYFNAGIFTADWSALSNHYSNGNYLVTFDAEGFSVTAIPEPATLAVLGLGLAGLGLARRRGRK